VTSHENAAELEIEVETELELVEASSPADDIGAPASWTFDPSDVVREEVGLRNLLGAAEALARTEERW
jgi:hypothetical protein